MQVFVWSVYQLGDWKFSNCSLSKHQWQIAAPSHSRAPTVSCLKELINHCSFLSIWMSTNLQEDALVRNSLLEKKVKAPSMCLLEHCRTSIAATSPQIHQLWRIIKGEERLLMGWAKLCKFNSSFEKTLTFSAAIETIFFKCIVNKNRALWLPIYSICTFSFKYGTVCLFLSEVSGLLVSFSLYLTIVIRKAQVSLSVLREKKLTQLKDANIHFYAVRGFGFLRADESGEKKNLSLSMTKIMS